MTFDLSDQRRLSLCFLLRKHSHNCASRVTLRWCCSSHRAAVSLRHRSMLTIQSIPGCYSKSNQPEGERIAPGRTTYISATRGRSSVLTRDHRRSAAGLCLVCTKRKKRDCTTEGRKRHETRSKRFDCRHPLRRPGDAGCYGEKASQGGNKYMMTTIITGRSAG